MEIRPSKTILGLRQYAFAEVADAVENLKKQGIKPIDFGVGDPEDPTPDFIREATKKAVDARKAFGYPNYEGSKEYRETVAEWSRKRFNISLDTEKEICSSIGSKEAVINLPKAFIDPGDYVLIPNPGYPPYEIGTLFVGGKTHFMNLTEENNFLPDLEAIPKDVVKKAKIIWVNYPNNPTASVATKKFYKELVDFGHDNNILIASDEPYTENYYDEKPLSILEIDREGILAFNSLSKRSNMTGYRVGWVAGDEDLIKIYKKLKTQLDSGTCTFIQDGAIAALKDEKHVENFRKQYKQKRDLLVNAMVSAGLERCEPKGTIYMWQKTPKNMSGVDFAKRLLEKNIAVVVTPGSFISKEVNGINPGQNYVRLALVPTVENVKIAAEKISRLKF